MAINLFPDDLDEFEEFAVGVSPQEPTFGYRPMNEDEVKSSISEEILDAFGAIMAGTEIAEARRRSLDMFYGRPFGNEIEGRSQVVLTEVADTIHWIMPSLMKMFTGGEDIFEFVATRPEEEAQAEQATKFINTVFWEELDGFQILYDWFFTALLEKNGFVSVYWDERVEPKIEQYEGLDEIQLQMLLQDGRGLEVIEMGERESEIAGEPVTLFDVTVKQAKRTGKIKVRGIAPEEFMMARRAVVLDDDTPFCGERVKMTASDLIAMGFDPEDVLMWPAENSQEFNQERTTRLQEEEIFPLTMAERSDSAGKEMWVNWIHMRIDEDGDGYTELRHFMTIGDTSMELLSDDYANFIPYASLTATPIPFKFFGQSITDLVGDLQVIRTTLMRQMLDNLYLINNQQTKVVTGQVELSDLLTSRPGNVIRMDSLDSMEPVVVPPLPNVTMDMMNYLDEIREIRTGVSRTTQGLDGSALNGTATGVNAMMGASQSRVELIGRIFSSTGVKRLGKLLLRMYKQHDNKDRTVRLNGEWINVDPSLWNEDMTCKIKTGLGVGAAQEQIQMLMATIQLQKEAIMSGASFMVSPKDLYRAVTELNKAMGFRGADVFFTDPGDQPWPPPAPDAKEKETMRKAQEDQVQAQLKEVELTIDAQTQKELASYRREELDQKATLAREEMSTRLEIARLQMEGNEDDESSSTES